MKLSFAGTPEFAATALAAILAAGHQVALVLTQPDRPAGRGQRMRPSAVKLLAQREGLPLLQPPSLKDSSIATAIADAGAEAMVVAAYGLLVPSRILELPRRGCINIHASLLPRWRGAAPIQHALLAGDAETGISIMQMDAGLDTGPVLLQERLQIAASDTAATLHDRLAALGARLIIEVLATSPVATPQDSALASYAPKIERALTEIQWSNAAVAIDRQVRAFNPVPGAYTYCDGTLLKIWRVVLDAQATAAPGVVCRADADGIVVACGAGAVRILELQRAGGKPLPARAFLAGCAIAAGAIMGR